MCWPQCNSISFVRTLQCKNFLSRFAHLCRQSVHVCNKLLLSVFDSRMKGCGMCEAKNLAEEQNAGGSFEWAYADAHEQER